MARHEIECTGSRVVYANRWMTVREDTIRRADGSAGLYGVVEKKDFAIICAVQDGQLYLVEQYRYPVRSRQWELPQGTWDVCEAVHDPLSLARAELREETGLVAGTMQHAGRLYEAYGFCSQAFDVFLATDLRAGPQQLEPEEQGLMCRGFALAEVERMVCSGLKARCASHCA